MSEGFTIDENTKYLKLGTRRKDNEKAKTYVGAPYEVYALNEKEDSQWIKQEYEFAKVTGLNGDELELATRNGVTTWYQKLFKWTYLRGLLSPREENQPGSIITKDEVMALLARNAVDIN
ncbi:hypothetical protein ACFL96_14225 [Thermoproteota archaeon]